MKVILPDLMRVLLFGYKAATTKALLVFRTVMAQLETREASHIAVQMAEFLLPLLDDVRLMWKPHGWALGSCGMASVFRSPAQLLPDSCSRSSSHRGC